MIIVLVLVAAEFAFADVPVPPKKKFIDDAPPQAWWSEEEAGYLGGLVGGMAGLAGAAFGVVAGLGVARAWVRAACLVLIGAGILMLAMGFAAYASGQPWHVYFLPFVIGGVLTVVMGVNYPVLKRRFDQLDAQEFAGS